MRWRIIVEVDLQGADMVQAAEHALKRFQGSAAVIDDRLAVKFELEAPSVKRAARAAFVILGRIAGQSEPSRFELQRLD